MSLTTFSAQQTAPNPGGAGGAQQTALATRSLALLGAPSVFPAGEQATEQIPRGPLPVFQTPVVERNTVALTALAVVPVTSTSLPALTLPAGIGPFLAAGHAIDGKSPFADVPRGTGHARKRRVRTAPERIVSVSLLCEAADAATFDYWFETTIRVGVTAFTAPVADEESAGLRYWRAVWETQPTYTPLNLGRWMISGTLLLTGVGSTVAPGATSAAVGFGLALRGTAAATVPAAASVGFGLALLPSSSAGTVSFGVALVKGAPGSATSILVFPPPGSLSLGAGAPGMLNQFTPPAVVQVACGNEVTGIAATGQVLRFPIAAKMTLTSLLATLNTSQASGSILTVDLRRNGSSILSTLVTINNGQLTSATATQPVISSGALAVGDVMTVHVTQFGDGAASGLKLALVGASTP